MRFGRGENIIFLHGWGGCKEAMLPLAKRFSEEYTVTVPDLYGFGDTPHPDYPLCVDDYVEGVFELIKLYKMKKAILVGHSFGGRVALAFALKYPTFVDKLVLLDASGIKPRRRYIVFFKRQINKIFIKLKRKPPFLARDYLQAKGMLKRTFSCVSGEYFDELIKGIRLPTLVVWGSGDRETPLYMGKKIAKLVKGARLLVIKGAGHFAYIDKLLMVTRAIKEFLGEDNVQ